MGVAQYIVYIVLLQSHALKNRERKRRAVLEHAAGEKIVYVRDIKRTMDSGYHQFLISRENFICDLFILRNEVFSNRRVSLPYGEFKRKRHFKRAVVNDTVTVGF